MVIASGTQRTRRGHGQIHDDLPSSRGDPPVSSNECKAEGWTPELMGGGLPQRTVLG